MVNQSIIYDEWLIKEFLRIFLIHAISGVIVRTSDGDVTAQSSFTAWKVERRNLEGTQQPCSLLLLSARHHCDFFFLWRNSLKA